MEKIPKVLFICWGNVMRSQMAEAFYNHLTKTNNATSAGTLDYTPEKYKVPNKEARDVMEEESIDISNQKVKYLTKEMIDKTDEIYIMCEREKCPSFLLDSPKIQFIIFEDPDSKGIEKAREIKDLIKAKVKKIIKQT